MKTYRELKLIGSHDEQMKLIALIEQRLGNGWARERDREANVNQQKTHNYIAFSCSKTVSRPAVGLTLTKDKNGYFYVIKIISREFSKLGIDLYNAILEEFLTYFVEPAAKDLDIEIRTTPGERTIDNAMSSDMSQLLKTFSDLANKSSGGTHPYDRARFLDFIIQSHKESSLLDEENLNGLLMDNGWSEDNAFDLSCKYRFARDLLKHYDTHLNQD